MGRNKKPFWTFTFNDSVVIKVWLRADSTESGYPLFEREAFWHTRYYLNGNLLARAQSWNYKDVIRELRLKVMAAKDPDAGDVLASMDARIMGEHDREAYITE